MQPHAGGSERSGDDSRGRSYDFVRRAARQRLVKVEPARLETYETADPRANENAEGSFPALEGASRIPNPLRFRRATGTRSVRADRPAARNRSAVNRGRIVAATAA